MPRRHIVHHDINTQILSERQPMWQLTNGSKFGHRIKESGVGFFALILHHWILGRTFRIFFLAQPLTNDALLPTDVRALCVSTLKREVAISDRFSHAISSVLDLVCLFAITCEIWRQSRSAQSGRKERETIHPSPMSLPAARLLKVGSYLYDHDQIYSSEFPSGG